MTLLKEGHSYAAGAWEFARGNSFLVKRMIKISYGKRYILRKRLFNSSKPLVKPLEGDLQTHLNEIIL
jgi:hypothetical protein